MTGHLSMIAYQLKALTTLFVVVDPIGLVAIFLATISGLDPAQQRIVAVRACIVAGAILIGAALIGARLLAALGIGLPAFHIAGGLLLFWIGFEMIFEKRTERKNATAARTIDHSELTSMAVFPLAIPLIAGPGAISAVIVTAARAPAWYDHIGLLISIAAIILMTLVCFLWASRLGRLIGPGGQIVVTRLFGLVLAALAVQIAADGIREM